jgi:hypothetical protein
MISFSSKSVFCVMLAKLKVDVDVVRFEFEAEEIETFGNYSAKTFHSRTIKF